MSFADRTTDFASTHIATATTTQVKVGTGTLKRVLVNTPVDAGTISLIDNTTGSTVNIGVITSSGTIPFSMDFDAHFSTGLRVITTQAQDVTIIWQ